MLRIKGREYAVRRLLHGDYRLTPHVGQSLETLRDDDGSMFVVRIDSKGRPARVLGDVRLSDESGDLMVCPERAESGE